MQAPVRAPRHGYHASLTNFDDIKILQADIAKHNLDAGDANAHRLSRSARSGADAIHPHNPSALHLQFQPQTTGRPRAHTSARLVPTSWNPAFLDKPHGYRRYLITHPTVYPVCTLHLAATTIQRWWRSLPKQQRTKRSRRRLQTLPTWQHPWERLKQLPVHEPRRVGLIERQAEGGVGMTSASTVSFHDHCATVIQRAWRASRERRWRQYTRRRTYRVAARSIQDWWWLIKAKQEKKKQDRLWAAIRIQRAFRAHADRRIYHFFRDLILSRQNSNPIGLLKALEARDALLSDPASGLYVRLRLGGPSFPPLLFYKLFTAQPIIDLNAFAPRNYALDQARAAHSTPSAQPQTDVSQWYQRWENNGWRVVGGGWMMDGWRQRVEGEVNRAEKGKVVVYHHPNKEVRKVDAERRRKERRVEWLKKMYQQGKAQEGTKGATQSESGEKEEAKEEMDVYHLTQQMDELIGQGKEERAEKLRRAKEADMEPEWEDDVDDLVDWAAELDFDDYQKGWTKVGVTRPAVSQRGQSTEKGG